jgi:hypothetical protein
VLAEKLGDHARVKALFEQAESERTTDAATAVVTLKQAADLIKQALAGPSEPGDRGPVEPPSDEDLAGFYKDWLLGLKPSLQRLRDAGLFVQELTALVTRVTKQSTERKWDEAQESYDRVNKLVTDGLRTLERRAVGDALPGPENPLSPDRLAYESLRKEKAGWLAEAQKDPTHGAGVTESLGAIDGLVKNVNYAQAFKDLTALVNSIEVRVDPKGAYERRRQETAKLLATAGKAPALKDLVADGLKGVEEKVPGDYPEALKRLEALVNVVQSAVDYQKALKELAALRKSLKDAEPYRSLFDGALSGIEQTARGGDFPKALADLRGLMDSARQLKAYTRRRSEVDQRIANAKKESGIASQVESELLAVDGHVTSKDYKSALAGLDKVIGLVEARREQIKADLAKQLERADPFDVRLQLARDGAVVRKEVTDLLKSWDLVAAAAAVERFKTDVDRAVRRAPIDLDGGGLKDVLDTHAGARMQNARYVRNVEQARSAAMRLVDDYGNMDLGAGPFREFPFINTSDDIATLQKDIASSPHKDLPQSTHALKMLKKLHERPELQEMVQSIKAPDPRSPACDLIRSVLGLPADAPVGEAQARRAAVASLLTKLRQHDVGSCFATSIAIHAQDKLPDLFLRDVKSLIETGTIVRSKTDPAKAITVPRVDPRLHEKPAFQKALDALGVPKGEQEAALNAALVELRKGLDPSRTDDPFTPAQVLAQVQRARPAGGKTPEELKQDLDRATGAYRDEGKVVMPLNPDASRSDLTTKVKVSRADSKLHEAPAVVAALDAFGIPEGAMKKTVDDALAALRVGLDPSLTEDSFTPEQVLDKIAEQLRAGGKAPDETAKGLSAAKLAFQGQQENRLLRAWEYTVASMAELGEDQGKKVREEARKAAIKAIGDACKELAKGGAAVPELQSFAQAMMKAFDEAFKAEAAIRYDASVVTEKSADGSSSRGVWVLQRKDGTKVTDKASQDVLVKDVLAEAAKGFTAEPRQTWAARVLSDSAGKALSAGPPAQPGGAYNAGTEDLLAAFYDNPEPVVQNTKVTARGDDLLEWVLGQNKSILDTTGPQVGTDGATYPMSGGPHAYSLKPGSGRLHELTGAINGGRSARDVVDGYKVKNRGVKDTKLPLDLTDGSRVKDLVASTCKGMHASWADALGKKIEALGAGGTKTEITPAELKGAVDDLVDNLYAKGLDDGRVTEKAKNRENLGKKILSDTTGSAPKVPFDLAGGSRLMGLVANGLQHVPPDWRDDLTADAKKRLQDLSVTEVSPAQIKGVIEAVIGTDFKKRALDVEKKKGHRVAGQAVLADTSPEAPTVAIDVADHSHLMKLVKAATAGLPPEFVDAAKVKIQALRTGTKSAVTAAEINAAVKAAIGERRKSLDAAKIDDEAGHVEEAIDDAVADGTVAVVGTWNPDGPQLSALLDRLLGPLAAVPGAKQWVVDELKASAGNPATTAEVKAAVTGLIDTGCSTQPETWRDAQKEHIAKAYDQEVKTNDALTAPFDLDPPPPANSPLNALLRRSLGHLAPELVDKYAPKAWGYLRHAATTDGRDTVSFREVIWAADAAVTFALKNDLEAARNQAVATAESKLTDAAGTDDALQAKALGLTSPEVNKLIDDSLGFLTDHAQRVNIKTEVVQKLQTVATPSGTGPTVTTAQVRAALDAKIEQLRGATLQPYFDGAKTKAETGLATAVTNDDALLAGSYALNSPELTALIDSSLAHFKPEQLPDLKEKLRKRLEALGGGPVALTAFREQLDKLIDEDRKKEDEGAVKSIREGMTGRLAGAAVEELAPPVDQADLDPVLDKALKKIAVPEGEHGSIKSTVKSALPPRATMVEIEKALADAISDPTLKAKVRGSLRPEGAPGIVFADTNWEDGDQEIHFTMVVNPLNDELEMWQVNGDGSNPRPLDQAQWVTNRHYAMPKNPTQVSPLV